MTVCARTTPGEGLPAADSVAQIAAALLYEGYILWPYRRSAQKNRKRWTLGGFYPRAFSEQSGGSDPWHLQAQCLVAGENPEISVAARFLHVVDRQAARVQEGGALELVDEIRIGSERHLTWQEAAERKVEIGPLRLSDSDPRIRHEFTFPAGRESEMLLDPAGRPAGALIRTWETVEGVAEVTAGSAGQRVWRLMVKVSNTSPWAGDDREEALKRTLVSTHAILRVTGGEFASLLEPPDELRAAAAECTNLHCWPVLVGEPGDRQAMLASPIILYDYPRVAPESPGDLFDGGEIDQLLTLNILALTDEEKEEMRASDPRTREILKRAAALTLDDFRRMNGAIREFRMLGSEEDFPMLPELSAPAPASVAVGGTDVGPGSRVRLRPRGTADIMDTVLAGKEAIVEKVEQDLEGRIQLVVTVVDDPAHEIGTERMPAHRFFFSPEEVEPLEHAGAGER